MSNLVNIYFGSETGTSEFFANELCDRFRSAGVSANVNFKKLYSICFTQVVDLANFNLDFFSTTVTHCIFVVSTTGDGEATKNAVEFERSLIKMLSDGKNLTDKVGLH